MGLIVVTTASGGSAPKRMQAWLAWWSHFETPAMVVAGSLLVANSFVSYSASAEMAVFWTVLFWALVAGCWATIVGNVAHDAIYPCDFCIERFPLDASAKAEQHDKALRAYHAQNLKSLVAMFAIIAVVQFAFIWVLPRPWSAIGSLAWWLASARLSWRNKLHRQLSPWCPQCRRGGGDDECACVPEPTPPSAKVDA